MFLIWCCVDVIRMVVLFLFPYLPKKTGGITWENCSCSVEVSQNHWLLASELTFFPNKKKSFKLFINNLNLAHIYISLMYLKVGDIKFLQRVLSFCMHKRYVNIKIACVFDSQASHLHIVISPVWGRQLFSACSFLFVFSLLDVLISICWCHH